jgi:hypothetical protein|tara:strand:- start:235 stop:648 length:414 start_codon:yes stop_codon:yes gene_type:complete
MSEKKKKKGNPALYKGMKPLNPHGRPKGSMNKWSAAAIAYLDENLLDVLEVAVAKAKDGDVHCIKMILDRRVPTQKAIDANKNRGDSQIIINVASLESIEQKAKEYNEAEIIDPEEKSEEEVIATIDTSPMAEKFVS